MSDDDEDKLLATHEFPNGDKLDMWVGYAHYSGFPRVKMITLVYYEVHMVDDYERIVFVGSHRELFAEYEHIRAMEAFVDRAFNGKPMYFSKFCGTLEDFLSPES